MTTSEMTQTIMRPNLAGSTNMSAVRASGTMMSAAKPRLT